MRGGCVSVGTFAKRDAYGRQSLLGEAAGLRWRAEAEAQGGLHAARVERVSETELVEERISCTRATRDAAERIGVALAHTHAAGAPWWGCPPAGWQGAYRLEHSRTLTTSAQEAPASWGAFYARFRIMPAVRTLCDGGLFGVQERALFERVCAKLEAGAYDAPQPELVGAQGHAVARLHGDLWAGNLLWDANPQNHTGGAFIDPMAHGGHAETDLAMLALFGCSFLDTILASYDELSPLADGWRERVGLHQLSPLLLHCVLFGGHYVGETLRVARGYA